MPNLNNAEIGGLAQSYGLSLTPEQIDTLNGQTGGDAARVQNAFDIQKSQKAITDASNPDNVIANAQKLNQFQIQANQSAIQQLQSQQAPLEQRYKDLVASIKGNQQVATNQQALATNNELGKRGISSNSGVYQQDMANALLPVGAQYSSLLNQADTAHSGDVNNLAFQLAQLQSGNPANALSGATGLAGQQQSGAESIAQMAQNLFARLNPTAAEQAATNQANAQTYAIQHPSSQQQDQYATLSEGQTLYDLLNGKALYTASKTYKPTGGATGGSNTQDLNTIFNGGN